MKQEICISHLLTIDQDSEKTRSNASISLSIIEGCCLPSVTQPSSSTNTVDILLYSLGQVIVYHVSHTTEL